MMVPRRDEDATGSTVLRRARRLVVAIIGGSVVLVGAAMIVLPGPAFLVIPAGLAILATEFVWARRLLARAKARLGIHEERDDAGA